MQYAIDNLDYLFGGGLSLCLDARDTNDDGAVDIADPVFLLSHLFSGGPEPSAPFAACGLDPTPDALGCMIYTACP